MEQIVRLRSPLLAGLVYALAAAGWGSLHTALGTTPLLWLPVGIAVAAFCVAPASRWAALAAALFAGRLGSAVLLGDDFVTALGLAFGSTAGAALCASISIRVLAGRRRRPGSVPQIAGLFSAALVGALASALIALPFRSGPDLTPLGTRLLADMLGVLSITPIALCFRNAVHGKPVAQLSALFFRQLHFVPVMIAALVLSLLVLLMPNVSLLFVLVMALVVAVLRFGQIATAMGVLTYAVAAALAGMGGRSPLAYLASADQAVLLLQGAMLLMLATSLPLALLLQNRDRLSEQLQRQNDALAGTLTMLTIAEKLAGIGRWRLDLRTGRQEWSALMLEMNGLDPRLGPDPGDVRALLPDRGVALFGELARHRHERDPYTFDYMIGPPGGVERTLRMVVRNEFDEKGRRSALFAVAMDITDQMQREQALELARQEALDSAIAAHKLAQTDPLTGLANRRCTFEQLEKLAQKSVDEGSPLSIVLFDIDRFKRINDDFGHQTGDEVLLRVADLARSIVRSSDLVGRIGGEEFVWLIPGLDAPRARELAERLRASIEYESGRAGLPGVTISIGIAQHRPGDTPQRAVARADAALYSAKEGGRNQVKRAA